MRECACVCVCAGGREGGGKASAIYRSRKKNTAKETDI